MTTPKLSGRCFIFIQGYDKGMTCPLCQSEVKPGVHHECVVRDGKILSRHGYGTKRTTKKGGKA